MKRSGEEKEYVSARVEDSAPVETPAVDFGVLVYPPYHGEPTHPDPRRLIAPLSAFTRDPQNARLHQDKNLRHIRASLRRGARGQQSPIIVDRAGKILKGNGTHESAELEGWSHIWYEVSNLEGAEATAYAVADNATGLSSQWDYRQLAENIQSSKDEFDGGDLEFSGEEFGFDDHELKPLLNAEWKPAEVLEGQRAPKQRGSEDPHTDLEEGDRADRCAPIIVTPNMRTVIDQAVERVRLVSGDMSLSEGRCVELFAADYLSGAPSRDEALAEFERVRGTLPESEEEDTPGCE
jgi:hypothetical protein